MRIGIATVQVPFVQGGAEIHARNLLHEMRARGVEADLITIPFKWYPPEAIIDSIAMARLIDLTEANGTTIDRIIGLKFPAYLIPHPNKVLWVLHQYRSAYELWDHPKFGDLINLPGGRAVRNAIHHADRYFIPEARAIFANSRTVAQRLLRYNGIAAAPLYHPPGHAERFHQAAAEDYFFFPSRITPLKRQSLVIEALALCRQPVRVIFAGAVEVQSYFDDMQSRARSLGLKDRVVWKGFTSENDKIALFAASLGVVYPPVDEDYGYVTLEAMLSHKPVITVEDAGGPLEFVESGVTGLVTSSNAAALAEAMDALWNDRARARLMGGAGYDSYHAQEISWETVINTLLS